ncbi:MAG: queuosine salvage family protein [Thermomicrobiales bacterium]|nr:queuosine salvage family protein [Thermomicrobiales bacterium]
MFEGSIGPDSLAVLRSTRPLIANARSVTIVPDAVEATAALLANAELAPPEWETGIHFRDDTWRTAAWVLVLDALNFCFWSERPDPELDGHDGTRYDGYWALVAALRKAIDRGQPLWDADYLLTAPDAELVAIFDPADPDGVPIPQLERRVAHLREVGVGLRETPIEELISAANGSAVALADAVRRRFPSFNDIVLIDGQEVRFLKRAQILIADLHGAFGGAGLGKFHDLHELTAFADYKVPQVLRRFGVLRYSSDLEAALHARQLIPANSPWELEIRAATIWGCELIRQALVAQGKPLMAMEIDWALWLTGQELPAGTEPYHRTPTIFY